MDTPLRVVLWNANVLSNHKLELQTFINSTKSISLSYPKHTLHHEQFLQFHTTQYTAPYTPTIRHTEGQQSYSVVPYIRNSYIISLIKTGLQPSSLTLVHGHWRYPPSTAPPASSHIYRRLYDVLQSLGISIPDWWGLEHETYCLESTAYHTEREKSS